MSVERSGVGSAASSSAGSISTSPTLAGGPQLPLYAPIHTQWGVEDMQLFYHYMSAVAVDTGDDHLWRHQLPRIAFRRHTILHLILAISALHLARSEPNQSADLVHRAESHMNVGLRRATHDISSLDEENCAELYITTILICTYTFAKKPGPRNLLVVAEGQESAWWELFRGVRLIVERIGLPTILARLASDVGPTDAVSHKEPPNTQREAEVTITDPLNWEVAFDSLSGLIDHTPPDQQGVYQATFNMLKWCFHDTFGATNHRTIVNPKFQTIMAWLYVLDDQYVNMLKEADPVAMILLAHFAILLQTLEAVWFLDGWSSHILQGVHGILEETSQEQWLQWLEWPQTQVQNLAKTRAGAAMVTER